MPNNLFALLFIFRMESEKKHKTNKKNHHKTLPMQQ